MKGKMKNKVLVLIIVIILFVILSFILYWANSHGINLPKEEHKNVNELIEENEKKISKYAQMYIDMIDHIMEKDKGLQGGIKFIAIDFTNFVRPITKQNENQCYTLPSIDSEQETKKEIMNYLNDKYEVEIKDTTLEELEKQGLYIKDEGISDGILIYVSQTPTKIEENSMNVSLTKYRGPLGAYFIDFEMKYKNDKWNLKVVNEAIS